MLEGNIRISLDSEDGAGFLGRLYRHLLQQTVDNLTSVEMEPMTDEEESEKYEWTTSPPDGVRYCTGCSEELRCGDNITKHRLEKRWYLCKTCKQTKQKNLARNIDYSVTFLKRYCYMCSVHVTEDNCHSHRVHEIKNRVNLCDDCRVDIRQKWVDSEHKCIHCSANLEVGVNWQKCVYEARTHVCKACKRRGDRRRAEDYRIRQRRR